MVKEVVITATPAPTPIYNDYLINSYTPENTTLYTQEQVELLKDLYIKQKELEALEATMSSEPSVTPTSGTTITDESENLGFFQRLGSFINSVRKYIANIFKW